MGTEKLFVKSDINVGGQWTIQNKGDYFDRTGKFGLLSQVFCYIWFLLSSFHCTELYAVVVVFVLVWVCICVFILASWLGDQLHTTSTSQWWSLSCTVAGAERVDRPFARPFLGPSPVCFGVFWGQSNGFDPQHGGMMTSMHKVYKTFFFRFVFIWKTWNNMLNIHIRPFDATGPWVEWLTCFKGGADGDEDDWWVAWDEGGKTGARDGLGGRGGMVSFWLTAAEPWGWGCQPGAPTGCGGSNMWQKWQQHVAEMASTYGRCGSNEWHEWQE